MIYLTHMHSARCIEQLQKDKSSDPTWPSESTHLCHLPFSSLVLVRSKALGSSFFHLVFLSGLLPFNLSSCQVVMLSGHFPVRWSCCHAVFLSSCQLPSSSTSCLVIFFSSCQFVFLSGCLPVRSSSCQGILLSGCLPVRSSSCHCKVLIWLKILFKPYHSKTI